MTGLHLKKNKKRNKLFHLATLFPGAGEVSRLVDVHVVSIHLPCHDHDHLDGDDHHDYHDNQDSYDFNLE